MGMTKLQRIKYHFHRLSPTKQTLLVCLGLYILFLSARLLYSTTHISFSQDQARDAFHMKDWAMQGKILIGYGPKASVGDFYLPPFYYQLHYVFSLLSGQNPLIMQWVITFVEAATPVMLFLWLKLLMDRRAALGGAIAYFFFMLPTTFATSAWNPNMIPFFSTLAAYAWFRVLLRKERWPIVVGCLATTISIHLHYQAIVLVPFVALFGAIHIKNHPKQLKWWMTGAILSVVLFLPYFWVEHQSNWHNTRAIIEYFTQEHSRYYDRVSKVAFGTTFLPWFTERVLLNQAAYTFGNLLVGRFLFFTGFGLIAFSALTSKKWRWVLLYFVSILIMLRVYKGDKLEYYLSTLFVLPAFFIAQWWQRALPLALAGVLALAFLSGRYYQMNVSTHQLETVRQTDVLLQEIIPADESFGVLFHDDDIANVFAYILGNNPRYTIRTGSQLLLEVCHPEDDCRWDRNLMCKQSRAYTYSVLLKSEGNYQPDIGYIFPDYVVYVGKMNTPVDRVGYPLTPDSGSFGSDFILENVYGE